MLAFVYKYNIITNLTIQLPVIFGNNEYILSSIIVNLINLQILLI